jgi:hypothetical protein
MTVAFASRSCAWLRAKSKPDASGIESTRYLILCPTLSTRTTNGLFTKVRSLTVEPFKGDPAICSRATR